MREDLQAIFEAGVAAVDPAAAVRRSVWIEGDTLHAAGGSYDLNKIGRIYLAAAGKGAAPMARSLMDVLGSRIQEALVVVKAGHGEDLPMGRLMEASHPVPDAAGLQASEAMLEMAGRAGAGDLFLLALTGGASALLPAPAPGLDLEDLRAATNLLLECGAPIEHMNAVRCHLTRIGGGQLAQAALPAAIAGVLVSDVVGDDLSVIGSGPLSPSCSTFGRCIDLLDEYRAMDRMPPAVRERLQKGAFGRLRETPKPGDPLFLNVRQQIVASNAVALDAAAAKAKELGYQPLVLTARLTGEAREAARFLACVAQESFAAGRPAAPPACLLAGGETTVRVRGTGLGGRNQEMALSAAMALEGAQGVAMLCAGTDGTDGPTDAAGAFAFCDTVTKARASGMDPGRYLENNDAYHFFDKIDGLLRTGPTRTNVMDLAVALVDKRDQEEAP
jgi:hydroxypyruvate reductase